MLSASAEIDCTAPPARYAAKVSVQTEHVAIELPLRNRWDALQDVHLFSLSSSSLSVENSIRHRRELLRKAHLLHLEVGVIEFLL